jgi:Cu(I)/Ag(I) efflux system membrane protein CusA/SilA
MVALAVPFSCLGAFWMLYFAGYHLSRPVWAGLIALIGVDAQTGVFMLLYLDLAWLSAAVQGRLRHKADCIEPVVEGAARRIRPRFMTVATMCTGLVPILLSDGTGSGIMKRIVAPVIGGLATSFLMELIAYPVIYALWRTVSAGDSGTEHLIATRPQWLSQPLPAPPIGRAPVPR